MTHVFALAVSCAAAAASLVFFYVRECENKGGARAVCARARARAQGALWIMLYGRRGVGARRDADGRAGGTPAGWPGGAQPQATATPTAHRLTTGTSLTTH